MLALFDQTSITPETIIQARTPADVPVALAALQSAMDSGQTAIGYFAYELGYLLDPVLEPLYRQPSVPLIWFAIGKPTEPDMSGHYALGEAHHKDGYLEKCKTIIDNIHAGEIYQANLTFKSTFSFSGSPRGLFTDLRNRQPTPYAAYLESDDFQILSLSPELFISVENGKIITKPMKGTLPSSADIEDLRNDPKQRAENLMIVDLMRNDLGRIGKNIHVDDMFAVETHPTLHQMTSTISAKTTADLKTLLTGLFPAGSITGAPKIRAMQIVHDLEDAPRGAYCGAIGMLSKDKIILNVAIRTITIQNGTAEIGIGSGVVADSDPKSEYDECLLKMKFLQPQFGLIESFAKTKGQYDYWEEHIARLTNSASALGFTIDLPKIEADLKSQPDGMIRLVVERNGTYTITAKPLPITPPMRAKLSDAPLDSKNAYLPHKTTMRGFYDQQAARYPDFDEVVFINERGELCEGCRTNIFIERDGVFLTPPLSAGLLPGTLRARLLANGRAKEAVLYPRDLAKGAVFLGNGVRGLVPATVVI